MDAWYRRIPRRVTSLPTAALTVAHAYIAVPGCWEWTAVPTHPDDPPAFELAFGLMSILGSSCRLEGRFAEADVYIAHVLRRSRSAVEKAQVLSIQLGVVFASGKTDEAYQIGRQAMELLGVPFPEPTVSHVGRTAWSRARVVTPEVVCVLGGWCAACPGRPSAGYGRRHRGAPGGLHGGTPADGDAVHQAQRAPSVQDDRAHDCPRLLPPRPVRGPAPASRLRIPSLWLTTRHWRYHRYFTTLLCVGVDLTLREGPAPEAAVPLAFWALVLQVLHVIGCGVALGLLL